MAHRLPGRGACLTSTLVQTQGAGPPYKHWELLAGCHLPWCVRAEHLCQWGCWIECSLDVLTDTWRHSVSSTQLPRVQHRVCFLWGVKAVKCHSFSRKLPAYPMTPLLPSSNWDRSCLLLWSTCVRTEVWNCRGPFAVTWGATAGQSGGRRCIPYRLRMKPTLSEAEGRIRMNHGPGYVAWVIT